jgi:hypothetical protein
VTAKLGRIVALSILPGAVLVAAVLLGLRLHFQPPTVPEYALVANGDTETLRPGGRFEIEVRPLGPVTGAVGARAFLLRGDAVRPWDPPFVVDRDGSVRIAGPVASLFAGVPAGEWEVAVAVGRPEMLPTAPKDVLRAREPHAGDAAWRLVRRRVLLGG